MERADKSITFGCLLQSKCIIKTVVKVTDDEIWWFIHVVDGIWFYAHNKDSEIFWYDVVWHPYWLDRLTYMYKSKEDKTRRQTFAYQDIYGYCENRPELYLKPCIERPEQWQQLALAFLQTLPSWK